MSRRQRVHTFQRADLEMADRLGIEARALCGVWVDVEDTGDLGGGDRPGASDNGCMRCRASVRRIMRAVSHG